jgi:hypothetical protein
MNDKEIKAAYERMGLLKPGAEADSRATALDLDKLEALARAATPGPWRASDAYADNGAFSGIDINADDGTVLLSEDSGPGQRDAQFIAAANPAAVLDLIALARRATAPHADYTVDDSELARKIMVFLGQRTSGSMEPGADPLRDRLAERIALWRPAAQPVEAGSAVQAEPTHFRGWGGKWQEVRPGDDAETLRAQGYELATHPAEPVRSEPIIKYEKTPTGPVLSVSYADDRIPVGGAWHDAILAECMKVESCYQADNPVATIKALINWHYQEASGVAEGIKQMADNYVQLTCSAPVGGALVAMGEPEGFTAWLAREMPAGTVINDPAWWAPRILRAVAAESAAAPAEQTQAARDVLAERRRQVEQEGWKPEHDDQYERHELSLAAGCYLLAGDGPHSGAPASWPWEQFWWKPADDRRNLVKAAALILADIERIDRQPATQAEGN